MVVGEVDFHQNALRQEMAGNYDTQPSVFSPITNGSPFDQYLSTAVQLPHGEDLPGSNSRVRTALITLPSLSLIQVH